MGDKVQTYRSARQYSNGSRVITQHVLFITLPAGIISPAVINSSDFLFETLSSENAYKIGM
jgi:hypothetical protein